MLWNKCNTPQYIPSFFQYYFLRKENNHPPVQIPLRPYTHTPLMWLNSGFKGLFTIMLTPQLAHKAGTLAGQSLWLSQWDHYVPPTAARAHNLLNCRPGERPYSAYGPIGNTHTHTQLHKHTHTCLNILSPARGLTHLDTITNKQRHKHTLTKF